METILLFDYDGVIVDSMPLVLELLQTLAPKYGLDMIKTRKDVEDLFEKNVYESLKELGLDDKKLNHFKEKLGVKLLLLQSHLNPFPNIKESLEKISTNNRMIMITSNLSFVTNHFLKKHKLNFFEKVLGAEVSKSKVEKILNIKQENPNAKLFYIGDTTGDIYEGKKAKIKTVGVTWGYHSKNRIKKAKPDHVVNNPNDLVKLFT
jgi:phosphoglycolate phosphatase